LGLFAIATGNVTKTTLFVKFTKIGALIFGNAYVVLECFRAELIERGHNITPTQLVDAFAIGQLAPGPLLLVGTFLGYLLGGASGAVVATVALFLPGLLLAFGVVPLVSRLRARYKVDAFLRGTAAGCLGLLAFAILDLARCTITTIPYAVLAIGGAVALLRYRVHPTWVLASGLLAGALNVFAFR
jgi:chromate transporter